VEGQNPLSRLCSLSLSSQRKPHSRLSTHFDSTLWQTALLTQPGSSYHRVVNKEARYGDDCGAQHRGRNLPGVACRR